MPAYLIHYQSNLVPDLAKDYWNSVVVALREVVHEQVPDNIRHEIARTKQRISGAQTLNKMSHEDFIAHQQKAGCQRFLKRGSNSTAMTLGRGLVPWTNEEKKLAVSLAALPDYTYPNGRRKGHAIPDKIASALNETFHSGNPVRSKSSLNTCLFRARKDSEKIP